MQDETILIMVDCKKTVNMHTVECRNVFAEPCMSEHIDGMKKGKIKSCINKLLLDENVQKNLNATKPELLSIVLIKNKIKHLEFLKGKTEFNVIGSWVDLKTGEEYPSEGNSQLDIQFKDREDHMIAKRVTDLFKMLNKKAINERLLYTRTVHVEETSL